jgi:hypothetical protein
MQMREDTQLTTNPGQSVPLWRVLQTLLDAARFIHIKEAQTSGLSEQW